MPGGRSGGNDSLKRNGEPFGCCPRVGEALAREGRVPILATVFAMPTARSAHWLHASASKRRTAPCPGYSSAITAKSELTVMPWPPPPR